MTQKEQHPTDEEMARAFAEFDASQKKTLNYLDSKIHSRWTRKKEKNILIMLKQLVIMTNALTKDSIMAQDFDKRIMETIYVQSLFFDQVAKKCDIEFPKLTDRIDKLQDAIKDPAIAEVFKYLNERKKVVEEATEAEKKARDSGERYIA